MAEFERPSVPYVPEEVLPNNNRYALKSAAGQPPSADDFDGEFNWLTDVANDLYDAIQGVAAGILPGANQALNANKFPTTDGQSSPTISWTPVQTIHLADQAVTETKVFDSAITNAKIGPGAVTTDKLYPGAVTNSIIAPSSVGTMNIQNSAISNAKLADNCVSSAKIEENAITTDKVADQAITARQIADETITHQQIANNTITNQQLAPIAQIPVGGVTSFAGTTVPAGWLNCNGQAVSRTTYAALFAVTGTAYGAGDGATTFNLPDLRGRVMVGLDSTQAGNPAATGNRVTTNVGSYSNGWASGEQAHANTSDENGPHAHGFSYPGNFEGSTGINSISAGALTNSTTTVSGTGAPHNNMQPYLFLGAIIYAGV